MAKHAARKKGPAFKLPRVVRRARAQARWDAPHTSRGPESRIDQALSVTEETERGLGPPGAGT